MQSYVSDYSVDTMGGDEVFAAFLAIYVLIMLFSLAVSAVFYVLQSVSMYSVASRRGIKNPWLAWIPVGSNWIMGCISDQYRYVAKGQVKNKRKSLLILNIITVVISSLVSIANFVTVFLTGGSMMEGPIGMLIIWLVAALAMLAISIARAAIYFTALYDYYVSCEPGNGVLYLLLSIFVSWLAPILMMICRKKDGGMPPRKPDPAAIPAEPAPAAEEPATQPEASEEEPWQQEAPEQEPWQNPEE